jgi:hypothetical protein
MSSLFCSLRSFCCGSGSGGTSADGFPDRPAVSACALPCSDLAGRAFSRVAGHGFARTKPAFARVCRGIHGLAEPARGSGAHRPLMGGEVSEMGPQNSGDGCGPATARADGAVGERLSPGTTLGRLEPGARAWGRRDRTNDQEPGSQGGGAAFGALMGPGDMGSAVENQPSRETAGRSDGSEAVWGSGWGEEVYPLWVHVGTGLGYTLSGVSSPHTPLCISLSLFILRRRRRREREGGMGGIRECTHCTMENVPSCVRHSAMGTRPPSRRPRPSQLHRHTHFGGYAGYIGYSFCNDIRDERFARTSPCTKGVPTVGTLEPRKGASGGLKACPAAEKSLGQWLGEPTDLLWRRVTWRCIGRRNEKETRKGRWRDALQLSPTCHPRRKCGT